MQSPNSVAQLAAQHVELAINTLVDVMRTARRNDQHRVAAARVILDLAADAAVGGKAESEPPSSVADIAAARDRLRAAREAEQRGAAGGSLRREDDR